MAWPGTADIFAPDVNYVPARNVYPDAEGGTLGSVSAGTSPDTTGFAGTGATGGAVKTPAVTGHPVAWWIALLVLFAVAVWISHRIGQASAFSNIRASAYNVMFITVVAVLGLTILKVAAAKVKVPGLSDVILAS